MDIYYNGLFWLIDLLSTFLVIKGLISLFESQMFLSIAIHICKSIFIDENKVVIHTTNSKLYHIMQKAKAKSALKAYNQMQNAVLVQIKASLLCMFLHELPKQFFRCCKYIGKKKKKQQQKQIKEQVSEW